MLVDPDRGAAPNSSEADAILVSTRSLEDVVR
jgi:hypothetical protein